MKTLHRTLIISLPLSARQDRQIFLEHCCCYDCEAPTIEQHTRFSSPLLFCSASPAESKRKYLQVLNCCTDVAPLVPAPVRVT